MRIILAKTARMCALQHEAFGLDSGHAIDNGKPILF